MSTEKTSSQSTGKAGAPAVGLWLRVGPDLALEEVLRDLRQIFYVVNGSDYERNMHALEIFGNGKDQDFREKAALVCAFAKSNGVACIYRGVPSVAHEIDADGVLLETLDDMAAARELFGEEGIVGLACSVAASRGEKSKEAVKEQSCAAHDAGVDFVTFGTGGNVFPNPEDLRFWTILSDMPAVIEGHISNDHVAYWVQAGAAFIDAGDYIWSHGKGVMQGTVNMLHAIDLALDDQKTKGQA
ncbi:MAG: thiamine phosphate synthase [Rhodospirillales bacterium]|nr:thiamine phosphate synthase [Rhodospirillales bacterium]